MDAITILTTIEDIYERFRIPSNLRLHMKRVAGVATMMLAHWKGEEVDAQRVIAVCLLHDLGNVLKIKKDDAFSDTREGNEEEIRDWMETTYGKTPKKATLAMVKALGAEDLLPMLSLLDADDLPKLLQSNAENKIVKYADLRVSPHGVVSLQARIEEAMKRYNSLDTSFLEMGEKLEEELFAQIDISPEEISEERVQPLIERLEAAQRSL